MEIKIDTIGVKKIVTGGSFATTRGIKIGSPITDVTGQYGTPQSSGGYLKYIYETSYIAFQETEEKVGKIEIGFEFD